MKHLKQLQADPKLFRDRLFIDGADGELVQFGGVSERWQIEAFAELDPAAKRLAGVSRAPARNRAWLCRPRGHSKTSDAGMIVTYLLFASRRPISGVCAAADQDQAKLLRDAITRLVRCNPWLGEVLQVNQYRVTNKHTGSELSIITSDSGSNYGLLVDFVIVDELTHWKKQDLWDTILSTVAKKSHTLLCILTNAGVLGSWQHELCERIKTDERWIYRHLDGVQASWMTDDILAEQRKLLPSISFQRLFENQWVDADGETALAPHEITRAISSIPSGPQECFTYFLGVDLGLKRDSTGLAVVGKHVGDVKEHRTKPRMTVTQRALCESGVRPWPEAKWTQQVIPGTGELNVPHVQKSRNTGMPQDVEAIERHIIELHNEYNFRGIALDPWQASYLVQRLQDQGLPAYEMPFTGPNLTAMCSRFLQVFREGVIQIIEDHDLTRDLKRAKAVERSYGARLDWTRNEDGHGDVGTALAIAILASQNIGPAQQSRVQRELVSWP